MNLHWRRIGVGLASGVMQSPAYVIPQLIPAVAATIGSSPAELAWLTPVALALPIAMGLLAAGADWFGGRPLVLGMAAASAAGVGLVALAGIVEHGIALALLVAGTCLAFASVRHGALVVAHETQALPVGQQLDEARALRRYLVVGIYLVPLPAGIVAERCGWSWAVGGLAVVQLVAVTLLHRTVRRGARSAPASLGPFLRGICSSFASRSLLVVAGGAFFAQATVFGFVSGTPLVLARHGCGPAAISAVVLCGLLAALFMTLPRARDGRFERRAGALPLAGLLVIGCGAALPVAAFALAMAVIELSKHWSQAIALSQARAGAAREHDHRRQAVVGLGANVGAVVGAAVSALLLRSGDGAWLALLLVTALLAWLLQAEWSVRWGGAGRHRRR